MEQPLDADVLSDTTPREMKEKEMQMVSAYDEAAVCVASDDPRLKDK